ncbi:MAG: cytochrome c family protein [Proteobacteria bacterium]|nr:cytochrome c family protein [Pseudomonadota bacterium]
MKKTIIILLGIILTISFSMISSAEEGNERKGKYTYRKVYQSCKDRGEVESATPTLSPDAKTQAQWDRYFEEKKYLEADCKEEWNKLSEEDILNIHAYLKGHAADSPTPAKCK